MSNKSPGSAASLNGVVDVQGSAPELESATAATREQCWMCQRSTPLTKAGLFRKHRRYDGAHWRTVECDGSGTAPVVQRPSAPNLTLGERHEGGAYAC